MRISARKLAASSLAVHVFIHRRLDHRRQRAAGGSCTKKMQKKKRLPGRAGARGSRTCKSRSRLCKRGLHSLRRLLSSSLNERAARA
eukprot:662444-Prymnesium_polylepis.1